MANLTPQAVILTGLNPTFAAATGLGDTIIDNDGTVYLEVQNGGGASIDVTIDSTQQCSHGFDHNPQVAVPAGGNRRIGPFARARFGASVGISYSGVTSVTVAAIKLVAAT